MSGSATTNSERPRRVTEPMVWGALLGAALIWAYWPVLGEMARRWSDDSRYSHGYLVPLFAIYLLWLRRELAPTPPPRPQWGGLLLVLLGTALHLAGTRLFVSYVEGVALLPTLAGIVVLVGGWAALRWSWPAIGFLIFMIPLPYRIEMMLGYPLQKLATAASTYILQTFGLAAVAEGFTIALPGGIRLGVEEACNGLGMLMMFSAFAVAVVLVVQRPPLDKIVILLSAVPIALVANVIRITVTGLLEVTAGRAIAHAVYHDLAGWLMMPLALAILWLELWLLSHLLTTSTETAPQAPLAPQFVRPLDPRSPLPPRGR